MSPFLRRDHYIRFINGCPHSCMNTLMSGVGLWLASTDREREELNTGKRRIQWEYTLSERLSFNLTPRKLSVYSPITMSFDVNILEVNNKKTCFKIQ